MSIGKNAIKRVENNGYSKVKTEAPDMVNSTVIGATSPEVISMVEQEIKAQKPATAPETTPEKPKKSAKKSTKKAETPKKTSYAIGDDIPVYFL